MDDEVKAAFMRTFTEPPPLLDGDSFDLSYVPPAAAKEPKSSPSSARKRGRYSKHGELFKKPKYIFSEMSSLRRGSSPRREMREVREVREAPRVIEQSEDELFAKLVEKRLKNIKDCLPKEKLKCDILKLLFECQFENQGPLQPASATEVTIPHVSGTVVIASGEDNSQNSLISQLSNDMDNE